jgi:glycosyltransferase involved in cell wall biosynthesis
MPFTEKQHTFVICAYQESPFLENCIRSLEEQTLHSRILMITSTPGPWLSDVAQRHGLSLLVNPNGAGIGSDWEFGLSSARTPLVTLAHQDDLYEPEYLKSALACLNAAARPLIFFSDYAELRGSEKTTRNANLSIKKLMLFPLRFRQLQKSRWVRRRVLSLGNPVCCPAVTYVRQAVPSPLFDRSFSCNLDWAAWARLADLKGSFAYLPVPLMQHRIHSGSTTTKIIGENKRVTEDLRILRRFWPSPLANLIERIYSRGEQSNSLGS